MDIGTIKPRALKPGDSVAIVAPSGIPSEEALEHGVKFFESLGLKVKMGESVKRRFGYLAGSDEERALDLMRAWSDPEVGAIIAARGGYGAMRILPFLDFERIRRSPKILLGYSDITALHLAIWKEARIITLHGPIAEIKAPPMNKYNRERLVDTLFGLWPPGELEDPEPENVDLFSPQKLSPERGCLSFIEPGKAQGKLVGGNLSLIASTIGTRWEIDTKGNVLFLEDVGEKPYRIDRMLCQLQLSGKLKDASGFCLGSFTDCEADPDHPSFTIDEVLRNYFSGTGKPCITKLPVGHGKFNGTIPMGIEVCIESCANHSIPPKVSFLEKALC